MRCFGRRNGHGRFIAGGTCRRSRCRLRRHSIPILFLVTEGDRARHDDSSQRQRKKDRAETLYFNVTIIPGIIPIKTL